MRILRRAAVIVALFATLAAQDSVTAAHDTQSSSMTSLHIDANSDLLVHGIGDSRGYHIMAADAHRPTRWQTLATLSPAIDYEGDWIGNVCVTGNGRYVVATIAPRTATNSGAGIAHGGFAYSINVATGHVRPLIAGVTLASFSPECGRDSTVAITRFLGDDDVPTQVLLFDAGTGHVQTTSTVPSEVTSAAPTSTTAAIAADGRTLVRLSAGTEHAVATLPGQIFDVHANRGGGADFLSVDATVLSTADVWRWEPNAAPALLGKGALTTTALMTGRAGLTAVRGATPTPAGAASDVQWLGPETAASDATSLDLDAQLISLSGTAQRFAVKRGNTQTPVTLSPGRGQVTTSRPPGISGSHAGAISNANTTTPTCAVVRNGVHRQVPQPSPAQVNWAVEMASHGWLTQARTGDPTWKLKPYTPSKDFRVSTTVPREVLSGIFATESNWQQASRHAAQGVPGNPNISNYYGVSADQQSRDYNNADCGYGISQQTDGMRLGDTLFSRNIQRAVALDYVENVYAGAATLAKDWRQLKSDGIIANDGDPKSLENWYFAIWAYNTGIHQRDAAGNFGLGWVNNPVNPIYPANRDPFLRDQNNNDAQHPQDWPYQERVIGFMETPLVDPVSANNEYPPADAFLTLPAHSLFCSVAHDRCDPNNPGAPCTSTGSKGQPDYHCWWHTPATWVGNCAQTCVKAHWYVGKGTPEPPSPNDPFPPVCTLSGLPTSTIIVDEEDNRVAGDHYVNLAGCPNPSSDWHTGGRYTSTYGPMGMVDFHQLGVGFDGHIFFTHPVDPGDPYRVTGTWKPSLPHNGKYLIEVFVPSEGATVTAATYHVRTGASKVFATTIDQNTYSNQWVPIGTFKLKMGATVKLNNMSGASNGGDLAFDAVAFVPVT